MKYHVNVITPCGHLAVYHKELLQEIEKVRQSNPEYYPEATWDFVMTEGIERPEVRSFHDSSNPSANPQAVAGSLGAAFQQALNATWSNALKPVDTLPPDT
jgi:hypothetical protein